MLMYLSYHRTFIDIINLYFGIGESDREKLVVEPNTADIVAIEHLANLQNLSGSIQIDLILKGNGKRAMNTPINNIQIEIITQIWSIENFLRNLGDYISMG